MQKKSIRLRSLVKLISTFIEAKKNKKAEDIQDNYIYNISNNIDRLRMMIVLNFVTKALPLGCRI